MAFQKFVKPSRHGRNVYSPLITISRAGFAFFNQSARKEFGTSSYKFTEIFYDAESKKLRFSFCNTENESTINLSQPRNTCFCNLNSFLAYLQVRPSKKVPLIPTRIEENGMIEIDLSTLWRE